MNHRSQSSVNKPTMKEQDEKKDGEQEESPSGCLVQDEADDDHADSEALHSGVTAAFHVVQSAARAVAQEVDAFDEDLVSDFMHIGDLFHAPKNNQSFDMGDNMFEKTAHALFNSVMIYGIADFRKLMRQHPDEIQGDMLLVNAFMKLPITDSDIMKVVQANFPLLQKYMKKGEVEMYLSALQRYGREVQLQAALEMKNRNRQPNRRGSIYQTLRASKCVTIEVFEDTNSMKELVYSIAVDRENRQILVTFRGSVTASDWLIDWKMLMTVLPNPLKQRAASLMTIPQDSNIGIHAGFYTYLFGPRGKDDPTSKYDQIIEHIRTLLKRFQGFSLRISGHSLGAALGTLCTFRMAFEEDIKKPITCITFASPRTGNIQFVRAFQELEVQQRIICLRVANQRDVVTWHPDRLTCFTFFCQDAIFRHVGLELLLYPESRRCPDRTHRLRYRRTRRSRLHQLSDDFFQSLFNTTRCVIDLTCGCCVEDYLKWHSCEEYMTRLQRASSNLQDMSIGDVFAAYHDVVNEPSEFFSLSPLGGSRRANSASLELPG